MADAEMTRVTAKTSSRRGDLTVLSIFSGDLWAGAEVMIFHLLNKLKDDRSLRIVALSLNEGTLTHKLRRAGLQTFVIGEGTRTFAQILLEALRLFRGERIDIIHSHRYKENLLALFLAKFGGVQRLITTVHGLGELPFRLQRGYIPTRLLAKMEYFILKRFFTRVITVSQEIKKSLVRKYAFTDEKVHVIYNGIPLPPDPPALRAPENGRCHIGTVGRMVPVKDFDLFLEMAAEIRKQTPTVLFSILGDGPLKRDLIRKAKELKLEDSVELASPRPDPFPYYSSVDLYVNTSVHEGIPISVLEAMACGKAVVAPRVGGIPEIISHGVNGLLVDSREPKEFARSCMILIKDKDLRAAIGKSAWLRVGLHHSDSTMADCYRKLYWQLAG